MPDTSETYERGHPGKTPGLGEMGKVDNTPEPQPESYDDSRKNEKFRREMTADETQKLGESVDPQDPLAHGNRADAGDTEKEATGRADGSSAGEGN